MSTPTQAPIPTELLAPGGSLNQAVHALRAGADAVYCGAPRFSARSHAKNLDYPELRRLCGEADSRKASVYLALNTLVTDTELPLAVDSAWQAWEAGASALIVQDLGLVKALGRHGPPLPLHASTQMAIHSASGARQVRDWGITRVVLARELSLDEIGAIHRAVPELELEVFVHGALCYSFSGLCLASGLLLGRSGNRGDCGQICRTWSSLAERSGYWFSMNDLELSGAVRQLAEAGVHSFKIEGRMKPPEWTAAVVRHYRAILDADPASPRPRQPVPGLESARVVFGRQPSRAYIDDARGSRLINPVHAGSVGLAIGVIEEVRADRVRVKSALPLAVKDGIQLLRPGSPPVVCRMGIRGLELAGNPGRKQFASAAGALVWIIGDGEGAFRPADRGLPLAKVADHASNLPGIKAESLPLHHFPLAVNAKLEAGQLILDCPLPWDEAPSDPVRTAASGDIHLTIGVAAQPAQDSGAAAGAPARPGLPSQLERQLAQSGESAFGLAGLRTDGSLDAWFVPPSELKQVRRAWYARLEDALRDHRQSNQFRLLAEAAGPRSPASGAGLDPPPRSALSPAGDLPFITRFAGLDAASLARWQNRTVLPLSPVWLDDDAARRELAEWLSGNQAAGPFLFGLNNPAQLRWLSELPDALRRDLAWFADWSLYAANQAAARLLDASLPGLLWTSPWIEAGPVLGDAGQPMAGAAIAAATIPQSLPDPEFLPPLFISRACFRHQSLGLACPPGGPAACAKHFDYPLQQAGRVFEVKVRDCLSYTFSPSLSSKPAMSAGTGAAKTRG